MVPVRVRGAYADGLFTTAMLAIGSIPSSFLCGDWRQMIASLMVTFQANLVWAVGFVRVGSTVNIRWLLEICNVVPSDVEISRYWCLSPSVVWWRKVRNSENVATVEDACAHSTISPGTRLWINFGPSFVITTASPGKHCFFFQMTLKLFS